MNSSYFVRETISRSNEHDTCQNDLNDLKRYRTISSQRLCLIFRRNFFVFILKSHNILNHDIKTQIDKDDKWRDLIYFQMSLAKSEVSLSQRTKIMTIHFSFSCVSQDLNRVNASFWFYKRISVTKIEFWSMSFDAQTSFSLLKYDRIDDIKIEQS